MDKTSKPEWKVPWRGMLLALTVSAAALVVIFWQISNPKDVLQELRAYPLRYFLGAQFFVLAAWLVDGQRIGTLARALGQRIPWWELAIILGAANFLTLVTPFAGGGGALIVYYLYRRGLKSSQATAVVLGGGLAGQSALALLGLVTSSILRGVPGDLASYFTAVKIGALVYLLILSGLQVGIIKSERLFKWVFSKTGSKSRSAAWVAGFRSNYEFLITKRSGHYAVCVATAFTYYAVYYLGSFLLLSGFGVFHPWLRFAVAVLFGVAPVFSPIPGGAGLSEGISWAVLDSVLQPDELASFIVLWRTVVFYIPILLGGAVFVFLVMRWASGSNITKGSGPY
ncbi:MAG: flippase-like domain-containing protein [Firmicutes bacterium]|nr:flippase-like domain-containing protein [Bacillota bacterium]